MSIQVSGDLRAQLVEIRPGWSKQLGDYQEEIYEGVYTSVISLAAQLRNEVAEYSIEGSGAKRRLTARRLAEATNADEELSAEVRFHRNRITKSIFEHPTFDDVTLAERKIIKKAIDENDDSEIPNLTSANSLRLYELLLDKVDSYPIGQPTITRTVTASGGYNFISPTATPDTIYSTAQVLAVVDGLIDPSLLPDLTSGDPNKRYGWYYWGAEILSTTGGRKQMTQEWEYGLWADFHTFAPSSP